MTIEKIDDFANRTSHRNRIFKHLERVERSWEKNEVNFDFPISLEIHPTDRCNLSCKPCAYRDLRSNVDLSNQVFSDLVQEIVKEKRTSSVVFSGGGEPSCHPYLPEAIFELRAAGVEVGLLTNGVSLTAKLKKAYQQCNWIRFSVNATDEESYRRLNSSKLGTFERVCQNIKKISLGKKDRSPTLGISMMVQDEYDQLPYLKDLIGLAARLRVDYVMYRPLVKNENSQTKIGEETFRKWAEEIEKTTKENRIIVNYRTFLREKYETTWQERPYQHCPLVHDGLIGLVTASGDVFPCVALYLTGEERYSFGNLNNSSFKEIWRGQKRVETVKSINAKLCPYCRHDHMNEVLLKHLSGDTEKQVCSDPHWKFL